MFGVFKPAKAKPLLQRFHFDLVRGDRIIRDELGIEARDAAEAMRHARLALAGFRGQAGVPPEASWQLVVRNAGGRIVGRLSFQ